MIAIRRKHQLTIRDIALLQALSIGARERAAATSDRDFADDDLKDRPRPATPICNDGAVVYY